MKSFVNGPTGQSNRLGSNSALFGKFRAGFPALKKVTYLSICDKMILHDGVRLAVDDFLEQLAEATASRTDLEHRVVAGREKFARLMNVPVTSIAATRNVSDGVNSVAWAVPMTEGDNVVVSIESEHPNNVYPWLRLKRRGIELRNVATRPDGAIDAAAMVDAIDSRTRLMACASVTFAPGHRTDVFRLGEACRARGVFLLVDGVQSAGILKHDLAAELVDGFATSTSKGLLGLYGYGFLYVSPDWIDRLEPAYLSRSGVAMGTQDHSAMGDLSYALHADARRFELGSYNLAGAYASAASLELLLDLGSEQIEKHVLGLADTLHQGLAAIGQPPFVARDGGHGSHIVTIGQLGNGGHGFSNDPDLRRISMHLDDARIVHTIRRGQIRFGLHAYNNDDDITRVVDCMRDALASLQ